MNHLQGNLLDIKRGILVHQVNLLGVMGGGIAYQIREKWPALFREYRELCREKRLQIGDVFFFEAAPGVHVANLAGQESIGGVATVYSAYETALPKVKEYAAKHDLSIFYPFGIGCGLAGGDWSVIRPILEHYTPNATLMEYTEAEAAAS